MVGCLFKGVGELDDLGLGVGATVAFASTSEALGAAASTGPTKVAVTKRKVNAEPNRLRKAIGLLDFARLFEKEFSITMTVSLAGTGVRANCFRSSCEVRLGCCPILTFQYFSLSVASLNFDKLSD